MLRGEDEERLLIKSTQKTTRRSGTHLDRCTCFHPHMLHLRGLQSNAGVVGGDEKGHGLARKPRKWGEAEGRESS